MAEAASKSQRGMKSLLRAAGLAMAALLAACQGGPRIIPPSPGPVAPPPRQTPQVQQGIPQDTARHRVALLVPISGSNAAVGRSLANATQLALLDTNAENIRITTYDTAGGAALAAQRAIAEGNGLILGPLLSEDVRAVAPIARRADVPVLSFSNDTSVAGNGAYVLGYSPAQSIERVVGYARASGITDFAGLVPGGLYGERASTAFLRAVERAGGRVVAMRTYDRSPASISGAVGTLAGGDPFQAVLIADSAATAAVAAPVLRRSAGAGATARLLGTELWNTDSAIGSNSALNGAWFASVSDSYYRQFATKYRSRFGSAPYRLSTLGYDAVLLTVRLARDWPMGRAFPENRLVDKDGFAGLDGAFRFSRDGVAERALEVQEVRGGSAVTISPAPRTFE